MESESEARIVFLQEFLDHFSHYSLRIWDIDIEESIAEGFIRAVGQNPNVSVRYLIKDLDMLTSHLSGEDPTRPQ